jgi:hypothetical protein
MKIKKLYILLFITGIYTSSYAQSWGVHKYELYYGLGGTNLMSDVGSPNNPSKLAWVRIFNTVGAHGNAGLRYNFKPKQYVSANLALGQLYAEDPVDDPDFYTLGRKANTFFTEITFRYEYQIIKEKKKRTVYKVLGENRLKNINIPTYLFIGAGGILSVGQYSQIDGVSVPTENYINFAPVIPYGIGFKTRLSNLSYLNLEVGLRFPLSDKLDNLAQGANGLLSSDQYQFVTVNYIKKLKSNKKGLPRFKRR